MDHVVYETAAVVTRENEQEILTLCDAVFDRFDPAYLHSRLPTIANPALTAARNERGELVGFKFGYELSPTRFYSWLGGVHPDHRGRGVAQRLMAEQHEWAHANGYTEIETRTRATNTPMIVLNLRFGFVVAGYELNASNFGVVIQRKRLK